MEDVCIFVFSCRQSRACSSKWGPSYLTWHCSFHIVGRIYESSEAIGYCGPFSSPVQHKEHTTVYYNSTLSTCILEIDTQSISANGAYYCSLILPYPHENRFLKTNSSYVEIKQSDQESGSSNLELQIGLGVGLSVVFLCILVTAIIGILYYCVRVSNQANDVLHGPENGDNQDYHIRDSYYFVNSNEIQRIND